MQIMELHFTKKEIDFLSRYGIYLSDLESKDEDIFDKAYNKLSNSIMKNFINDEPNEDALIGEKIMDKVMEL